MLLAAVAGASAQCTIGDAVQPTRSADIRGQLVNLNNPATCSGNLTAWHFCYYRSSIDNDSSTYQIYFNVWRNVQGNSYELVSRIQIQGSPDLNAGNVICVDANLSEDQYVPVEQGDVIAVYTPFTLPTVSVLALQPAVPQELFQDTRGVSAFSANQFSRNDLRPENMYGLHLQADISKYVAIHDSFWLFLYRQVSETQSNTINKVFFHCSTSYHEHQYSNHWPYNHGYN